MDLYRLSSFVQVYEGRSFTEAARRAFVSRQAVSKAVAQLEAELGPLFERRARGVRPTALAEELYPHARRVVDECAAVERIARRYASGRAGLVALVLESNAAMTLPLGLTAAYAAARPDLRVSVKTLPSDQVREALAQGRADLAVAGPPAPGAGFSFERIFSGGLAVVFAASAFTADELGRYALSAGEAGDGTAGAPAGADGRFEARVLDVRALEGRTVFGVSPHNHVERQLEPYLRARGIDARLTYECTDTALATGEMEAGMGGVIVEAGGAAARFCSARYVHVPLVGQDAPRWEVGVVYRADDVCAPVARDLASFARGFAASAGVVDAR